MRHKTADHRVKRGGCIQRGSVWWISYTDAAGKRIRKAVPDAKDWTAANKERERLRAGKPEPEKQAEDKLGDLKKPLRDFLPEFLAYQKGRLTPQSYERTQGILELDELQPMLDTPVGSIIKADVDAFATARTKKRSAGTVYKEVNVVKGLFTWLIDVREVELPKSPARKYQPPCGKPTERREFLEEKEQVSLVIKECPSWLRNIVVVALYTGMRRGELLGLTWSMVDFKAKLITLPKTKNGDKREIPINQHVFDTLKPLHKKNSKPTDRVLSPSESGEDALPDNTSKAFKNVVNRLEIKDIHFHDLRRTTGSFMRMLGIDALTIAEILGHRDQRTTGIPRTTRIYQRTDIQYKHDAMAKLDAAFA